jgi:hypothetical protein
MIRASLPWVMAKSTRKPAMAQDQLHMAKELQTFIFTVCSFGGHTLLPGH